MKIKELENLHWLLLIAKKDLPYSEQRQKWNELQADFRILNKGLRKVTDCLGQPLSLTEGVYQD